ncbi:MAG TPA: hypothetical protein VHI52_09460, partial [Verrucomicrobiae bacterium]|nr:hypothetical protein [Verrucomicrobiae bacterium]
DRRDVYLITQNALADPPYENYIRAHYNRSAQVDPPFFRELLRLLLRDKEYETNLLAQAVGPVDRFFTWLGERVEKRRRTSTSWFSERDFLDIRAFAARLTPGPDQDAVSRFLYEHLSARTRELLLRPEDEQRLRSCLAEDLNRVLEQPLFEPDRFAHIHCSPELAEFSGQNPQGHGRIRLNRLLLEAAYPGEILRSLGGLYPDREIHTPSAEEASLCFQEYMEDVKRRMALNQLRPGEDVKIVGDRIQVSGQASVMAINGLIARRIFEQNPTHEFYVEESMPIDWMYPHLTPAGTIMKLHRRPLVSIPRDTLERDHEFWRQYSRRLTGEVVNYDTSVRQLTNWIEKSYLNRNFEGFTGDRKFIFDIDAQRAFSKLRSAIAGVYAWRLSQQCPLEYRPKSAEEAQRLLKEADFSFRQALAFCPWSPEAAFYYINLLLQTNRLDDAILVAETYLKLDPYSAQGLGTLNFLRQLQRQQTTQSTERAHG